MKVKDYHLASFCGIYCGACPSYQRKTCYGCKSEDRSQKRTSKFGCNIRNCCTSKNLDFCFNCSDYPCQYLLKLKNSHLIDDRYDYRHQILYSLVRISKIGLEAWLKEQEAIWSCPNCGDRVVFYENKCLKCSLILKNVLKKYMEKYEVEENL